MSSEDSSTRRISVDLPVDIIEKFDELKREWVLRSRGDVLQRLLEEVLPSDEYSASQGGFNDKNPSPTSTNKVSTNNYNETKALVLISTVSNSSEESNSQLRFDEANTIKSKQHINANQLGGINLPGFVQNKTRTLRNSLSNDKEINTRDDKLISTVSINDLTDGLKVARDHWISLYGNDPKENVIEAAMLWIARDIWPNHESSDQYSFTWTAANKVIKGYCPAWEAQISPSFERIIVIAGILEDPFASSNLTNRIPTLIRRFVNRFKKSNNVTSFQTLEATMTVHGALKLLGLPTQAGASLTLNKIREAYKNKAMQSHPDAGGSTESMRRINESYQLLKELYRN